MSKPVNKPKRRLGDRRDGTLIRDLDGLHFIMNIIYGKRTDNEAYISQNIDLTAMNEYLKTLNSLAYAYGRTGDYHKEKELRLQSTELAADFPENRARERAK